MFRSPLAGLSSNVVTALLFASLLLSALRPQALKPASVAMLSPAAMKRFKLVMFMLLSSTSSLGSNHFLSNIEALQKKFVKSKFLTRVLY
jgi:hypothetical protein